MRDSEDEGQAVLALVTCPAEEEARRIARALVDGRLAACVHISRHEAIYRWNGTIEETPEFRLLAKTTRGRFGALRDAVLKLHSDTLPAIIAVPVVDGHAAFMAWIAENCAA
jgi:periplasmic divalent cation tolerance protein